VRDGAAEQFLHRLGGKDAGELQQHERFLYAPASDCISHAAQLPRADAGELQMCDGFHHFTAALSPPCPRNARVGANSPSLCPTMFSVTKTGTCALPLCTPMVCPTIAGTIVDARLQVFTTRFSRRSFMPSILAIKCSATNGPFFKLRPIISILSCERSCCACVCCAASSCPSSSAPTAWSAGVPTSNAPRRRRADGRRGSSQCRARSGACRDGAAARLCRRSRSRARCSRAVRSWPGRRPGPYALRPTAYALVRIRLLWPSIEPSRRHCE